MCAIFASFDPIKLKDLHLLNSYRGELSYSVSTFRQDNDKINLQVLMKDRGKLDHALIDNIPGGNYYVCHTQAPTAPSSDIHPAVVSDSLLWHNGIVKQGTIANVPWDTQYILTNIIDYGWSSLSRIDGTFACIGFIDSQLYVFRNEISPLFVDNDLNISSTKFEGSRSIPANKVLKFNLEFKMLDYITTFETVENPYYFDDEVNA